MPTQAQIEGLIRAVMAILAGYALAKGIDAATWLAITGSVVGAATVLWTLYSNSKAVLVKQVTKIPEVEAVIVDPPLAFVVALPKVKPNDPERDYRTR